MLGYFGQEKSPTVTEKKKGAKINFSSSTAIDGINKTFWLAIGDICKFFVKYFLARCSVARVAVGIFLAQRGPKNDPKCTHDTINPEKTI